MWFLCQFLVRRLLMPFDGRTDSSASDLSRLAAIDTRERECPDIARTRAELDAMAREVPDWPLVHITRAICEQRAGDLQAAKAALAVALAVAPADPLAYKMLAGLLHAEGSEETASVVRMQWRRLLRAWGIDERVPHEVEGMSNAT
ncbi:hypothetical protein LLH03_14070 [bacterium]|nr:hypothetical protein [bacterium]